MKLDAFPPGFENDEEEVSEVERNCSAHRGGNVRSQ